MTYVLGISAFYHDSAAALIKEGKIRTILLLNTTKMQLRKMNKRE